MLYPLSISVLVHFINFFDTRDLVGLTDQKPIKHESRISRFIMYMYCLHFAGCKIPSFSYCFCPLLQNAKFNGSKTILI